MEQLISVTLPNYNHGLFLEQCIESVLQQSHGNFEILVTDDGSTDNSRDIITRFAERDNRVKPTFFTKNFGSTSAHREALGRATGALIYSYSADDRILSPHFFSQAVRALKANPTAGGVAGKALLLDSTSNQVVGGMGFAATGLVRPHEFISGFLSERPYFIPGISSIWRRECIDAIGGFDESLGPQTDYFVNHAIPAKFGVFFIDEVFSGARTYANRASYSGSATPQEEINRFRLFAKRMSSITTGLANADDWNLWWRRRYVRIIQKHFPFEPLY